MHCSRYIVILLIFFMMTWMVHSRDTGIPLQTESPEVVALNDANPQVVELLTSSAHGRIRSEYSWQRNPGSMISKGKAPVMVARPGAVIRGKALQGLSYSMLDWHFRVLKQERSAIMNSRFLMTYRFISLNWSDDH